MPCSLTRAWSRSVRPIICEEYESEMKRCLGLPSKVWSGLPIVLTLWLHRHRIEKFCHRLGILSIILIVLYVPVDAGAQTECLPLNDPVTSPEERLQALKTGGYALIFRHALKGDPTDRSCEERSKGITQPGRVQAQEIGSILAELGVPLAMIRSSEYCRTVQTAEEVRDKYFEEYQSSDLELDVLELELWNRSDSVEYMRRALVDSGLAYLDHVDSNEPPGNVVVVTHSNNLNACLSDPKVDFLEAAIVDLGCPLECPFADHALRIKYLRDQDTKALRLAEWYRAFKQGP